MRRSSLLARRVWLKFSGEVGQSSVENWAFYWTVDDHRRGFPARQEQIADSRRAGFPARQEQIADNRRAGFPARQEQIADNRRAGFPARQEQIADSRRAGFPARQEQIADSRRTGFPARQEQTVHEWETNQRKRRGDAFIRGRHSLTVCLPIDPGRSLRCPEKCVTPSPGHALVSQTGRG